MNYKMCTHLICYANKDYYKNQIRLEQSAHKFGIDKIYAYTEKDMGTTEFYKKNKEILDQKRGGGYWLWKPYFILETLKKIDENDILIYSDSGIEIIAPLDPLIKICQEKNIVIFGFGDFLNKAWTKRDCFVLMNCDSEKYWEERQYMASFLLFKNTKESRDFTSEWLAYCCNKKILTDIPNVCGLPNFPEFKDHRHDQSVLSLLTKKNNLETFRNPSQWGNSLKTPEWRKADEFLATPYSKTCDFNSPYGTLLDHHRTRHISLRSRVRSKLQRILKKYE